MVSAPLPRLPEEISALRVLALDLRWTWSHEGDALWSHVDEELWERTHNPWTVLQSAPAERLKSLASDQEFQGQAGGLRQRAAKYLQSRRLVPAGEGAPRLERASPISAWSSVWAPPCRSMPAAWAFWPAIF